MSGRLEGGGIQVRQLNTLKVPNLSGSIAHDIIEVNFQCGFVVATINTLQDVDDQRDVCVVGHAHIHFLIICDFAEVARYMS